MSASPPAVSEGAKNLQEKLHQLLTKLSSTIDLIRNWPESEGDDASIHVETTTKLISAIFEVIVGMQQVEGVVKGDNALKRSLRSCPVPTNLLDLLDHGGGLNPDCFSRGLLRESLGQLKGLKRRKLALKMLGEAVQSGLNKKDNGSSGDDTPQKVEATNKRKREEENEIEEAPKTMEEPILKKARSAVEETTSLAPTS